jgi:hypothetical protein
VFAYPNEIFVMSKALTFSTKALLLLVDDYLSGSLPFMNMMLVECLSGS